MKYADLKESPLWDMTKVSIQDSPS
jgi:hypothetical protein